MKYFILPNALVFSVSGPQAERYLQVRLTNDIKKLTAQNACLAAALTPQGRTEALFTVIANDKNSFTLLCDGGDSTSVLDALKRFIVTERIDINELTQQHLLLHIIPNRAQEDMGALLPPTPKHDLEFSIVRVGTKLFIARQRSLQWGWDVLIPKTESLVFIDTLHKKEGSELTNDEQLLLRLRAGIPAFPDEINSDHILVEAALSKAISFSKGCYTGQEVIAKIDALGKPPRLLTQINLSGIHNLQRGEKITSPGQDRAVGEVETSVIDAENNLTWAFATIRGSLDLAQHKLFIIDREATVVASALTS